MFQFWRVLACVEENASCRREWGRVGGSKRTMVCWQDAARWWAYDHRVECEQSMCEEQETERLRLVDARKMERKERRLCFLAERDATEREAT